MNRLNLLTVVNKKGSHEETRTTTGNAEQWKSIEINAD